VVELPVPLHVAIDTSAAGESDFLCRNFLAAARKAQKANRKAGLSKSDFSVLVYSLLFSDALVGHDHRIKHLNHTIRLEDVWDRHQRCAALLVVSSKRYQLKLVNVGKCSRRIAFD
jgi:hypothetical protein